MSPIIRPRSSPGSYPSNHGKHPVDVKNAAVEANLLDADSRLFHQGLEAVVPQGGAVFMFEVHCRILFRWFDEISPRRAGVGLRPGIREGQHFMKLDRQKYVRMQKNV